MILAHIAGVPVEETLLALAPVGVAGVGAWLAQLGHRARRRPWFRRSGPRLRPAQDESSNRLGRHRGRI
jgi:predicted alpha/beta-hydrolase family hydrolase